MMQLFRKYLVDNGHRDILNKFNAFNESRQYLEATDQTKKTNLSNSIMKQVL